MPRPVALATLWLLPMLARASGGEPATGLVHHVDTSRLSGLNLLLGQLYNDQRLLYAIVTTAAMAALGVCIAFFVDLLLGQLGFRVTRGEHRE